MTKGESRDLYQSNSVQQQSVEVEQPAPQQQKKTAKRTVTSVSRRGGGEILKYKSHSTAKNHYIIGFIQIQTGALLERLRS
jgi:hypothetical protein